MVVAGCSHHLRRAGSCMEDLKDAKAKAGSAVNRSPDLTGDIGTLGTPAQESTTRISEPKTTGPMPGSTLTGMDLHL